MSKNQRLRELLAGKEALVAPGAFDALSAKAVQAAGFPISGTTGYGMHGSILGVPDNGLLAFNEMLQACGNMAEAIDIPIMADAEGGYGNAINVIRTVREFERAGISGVFIEDQKLPPNCPFLHAPTLIPVEEMCGKIRAACDARRDKDFVIVARTDAAYDEAIERAQAYIEAGADMIKIVPKTKKELELVPQNVKAPLHIGYIAGKQVNEGVNAFDLGAMGYKIITFPISLLFMYTKSLEIILNEIKVKGTDETIKDRMHGFDEYTKLVGIDKFTEWEKKYLP